MCVPTTPTIEVRTICKVSVLRNRDLSVLSVGELVATGIMGRSSAMR